MTIRVLIVEDHELLAQSLAFALRADGLEVQQLGVPDPESVLEQAEAFAADLVLLDLELGQGVGSGVSLIEPLRERGARVVMLTGVTDEVRLAECVEAGAVGIVRKSEPFDRLVGIVQDAAAGRPLLEPQQRDELMGALRRHRADEHARLEAFERLTKREAQVLGAIMDGQSAEQIAATWVVSLATVRSQIRAVLQKLQVNSQLAAVALARKAGWTPPDPDGGR